MRWIFTLAIRTSIILIIIHVTRHDNPYPIIAPIIILIISYSLYLRFEYISPEMRLLFCCCSETYSEYISNFKEASPEVTFMNQQQIYDKIRFNYIIFPYTFCKDISENHAFDKGEIKGKYFVKLLINREIFSDDNETIQSFNQEKNKFFQSSKVGTPWVNISFNGLKTAVLLNNGNKCIFLNRTIYIIFVILALGEIYRLIVKLNTEEKSITIKKIIKNENEPQISSEAIQINSINDEADIVIHNNENKLNNNNIDLKKKQKENELNRNSERESVLKIQK